MPRILSDRNIFCSLGQINTHWKLSVDLSIIFSRSGPIERRCRKLLRIQWHKILFDESKDKDASKLSGADSIVPLLLRVTCLEFIRWDVTSLKKRDVTESHYGQNISSRSSLRRLEQVDDQGKKDRNGAHAIRHSCYHREKGVGAMAGNTSKYVKAPA